MKYYKRKIDIFLRVGVGGKHFQYECTTNTYPTCKSAKAAFIKKHSLDESQVRCRFQKPK
jgi:hypothetical protein